MSDNSDRVVVDSAGIAALFAALAAEKLRADGAERERDPWIREVQRAKGETIRVAQERDAAIARAENAERERDSAIRRYQIVKRHWRTLQAAAERYIEAADNEDLSCVVPRYDALRAALAQPERSDGEVR